LAPRQLDPRDPDPVRRPRDRRVEDVPPHRPRGALDRVVAPAGAPARTAVRRRLVAPVAVGVLAALYFTSFLTYGVQLEDEGLVLLQIARTARGELPYIDFHTGYTPGMFYLNAALSRWLGASVVPLRAVLALVNGTLIGLLYALARRLAGPALAAAAALGSAAALLLVVGLALGGIIGLDVFSWEGPMLLAGPLLLVVGRRGWACTPRDTGMRLWRAAGLVALGAALPTVPWLAWLALRLG